MARMLHAHGWGCPSGGKVRGSNGIIVYPGGVISPSVRWLVSNSSDMLVLRCSVTV